MITAVKTETKTNYLSPEEYLILEEKNPLNMNILTEKFTLWLEQVIVM